MSSVVPASGEGLSCPAGPVAPVAPLGIVKLNVAAEELPLLLTEALVPGLPVVVEPTAIVAAAPAAPVAPVLPVAPVAPVAPVSPLGIVNLKLAAELEPSLLTLALVPGLPVTVESTPTVAAAPVAPVEPLAPCGPGSPVEPGIPCEPVAPVSPLSPVLANVITIFSLELKLPAPHTKAHGIL